MWLLEDKEFDGDTSNYYGYVYLIENLTNGKKYIGRKYFTKAGYKTVKGKRKKIRKESDWNDYYGSSKKLLEEIESSGKENFRRTILRLCETRGETNYWEAKYQFLYDVLEAADENGEPVYYNEWISVKSHRSTIKKRNRMK